MSGQDFAVNDTQGSTAPASKLEFTDSVVEPTTDDELLQDNNLGLGYYSTGEYWQQVELFNQTMYGEAVFGDVLENRALRETKEAIAEEGYSYRYQAQDGVHRRSFAAWDDLDEEAREKHESPEAYAESVLDDLDPARRFEAVAELTGYRPGQRSPHARLMLMRHEASRSKGAHLLDNALTGVQEIRGDLDNLPDKHK